MKKLSRFRQRLFEELGWAGILFIVVKNLILVAFIYYVYTRFM